MSRYVDIIQDAIDGLQKYTMLEEELISLCRKTIHENEVSYKLYENSDSDNEDAYIDWKVTKARADLAFDILTRLGYHVDHYFMDTPVIVPWED